MQANPKADPKPFKVQIVWGEHVEPDDEPSEYEFATQAELDAFLHGVDEANGWMDMEILHPNSDGTFPESDKLAAARSADEEADEG